ncbi:hypothetical protein LF1_15510 [Rubripirellula obstinata]|uniref:Glycosyltransferase RgtA/B/C/D-like domain-containing protein n=1 Tax=Rubripirellula obstinata TaxID=406547 RepID=A0A5B1CEN1_9BACT|nr:hypothetical protein [Rubripirellula obstinata]KAA1259026.1 hypothetical protein LF1_15510 [Rubripirellula obstinata]
MQIDAMQLIVIVAWYMIPLSILFFSGVVFRAKSFIGLAAGAFTFNYLLRVIAILFNETAGIFAPKVQWRYGIGIYEDYVLTGNYLGLIFEPFGAQVLWNLPVWAFTDATRPSLLFSNAGASALAASLAAIMVRSVTSRRIAIAVMVIFSMYLGAFNFAMFGLRDPLLALASGTLGCAVLRIGLGQFRTPEILAGIAGAGFSLWLRPEQFFIVLFVLGLPLAAYYVNLFRGPGNKRRNFGIAFFLTVPLIAVGVGMILVATLVAGKNIGTKTLNPVQIADENAEDRFNRHVGSDYGSGSNIVDVQTYQNMPVFVRVPVQVIGLVVLPFPWQIRGPEQLLAFVDSVFLIVLLIASLRFVRARHSIDQGRWVVIALLATFAIGIVGMGFVISNAGNGFRMRMAVVPFLMLAAGVAIGSKTNYRRRRFPYVELYRDDYDDADETGDDDRVDYSEAESTAT